MELFLNLLWAFIVLAALAAWRGVWAREDGRVRRASLRECTAFACTLIFLFFAVSLTDDLHSNLDFLAESATSRRSALVHGGSHSLHHGENAAPSLHAAIFPRAQLIHPAYFLAIVLPFDLPSGAFVEGGISSGRAPPSLL